MNCVVRNVMCVLSSVERVSRSVVCVGHEVECMSDGESVDGSDSGSERESDAWGVRVRPSLWEGI